MINKKQSKSILCMFFFIFLSSGHSLYNVQAAAGDNYAITVTARAGGKIIAPDGSEVVGPSTEVFVFNENSSAKFGFEPDASKVLSDVILDSFSLGPSADGSYSFDSVNANHEITGVFTDAGIIIPESAGDVEIFNTGVPLSQSFEEIINKGVSYTAPVVSLDSADGARYGDEIYMTFFRPVDNGPWQGNLKKYRLEYLEREDCEGREEPEWTLVDKYGDVAVNCEGTFYESSVSLWSNSIDGGFVDRGGVGKILLGSLIDIDTVTEVNKYHSFRNIKTCLSDTDGSTVSFNRSNITKDELGVADDVTRDKIINYIYGYSYDAYSDGRPVKKRDWILGDIIHSEPKIIEYLDPANGDLQYRYIAVGSNDGMLHVFTDTDIVIGGKVYFPGEEVFAFIPADLLPELINIISASSVHKHMVDGSPDLFRPGTTDPYTGYFHKTLVFGERRGGRSYWALDVTNPDISTWTVKWHIKGGSDGIKTPLTKQIDELGYTWSKPFFTVLKISESENKKVMIFAGGYCPEEDAFPEAFIDTNFNGAWDNGEAHAVTVGGTEGYDRYNPSIDEMGRGIFAVDMEDGSLLFSVTYAEDADKTTGPAQTCNTMKYCFPADISVIPLSESDLLMYAADIYGQIWKIKYDYYADTSNSYESDLSASWTVKRIFTANPGSDLESGKGAGLITPFTDSDPDTPDMDNNDQGRKTFYSPDVSYFGNKWTNRPVLYFGTGDRVHSRYTMISNRFYAVADTDSLIYEKDLLNLTCDELDVDADADNDGEENDAADDESVKENLKDLFYSKKVNGFYRTMDEQGECKDISTDHRGEHILAQPILFAGNVYFTSYRPAVGDPSNPAGDIFSYALDYSFGTSALNYSAEAQNDYDPRNLEDTFIKVNDSTISSNIQIITKGNESAGMLSAGQKVTGVAEDKSMEIPGPPGGILQMLWEIEKE